MPEKSEEDTVDPTSRLLLLEYLEEVLNIVAVGNGGEDSPLPHAILHSEDGTDFIIPPPDICKLLSVNEDQKTQID